MGRTGDEVPVPSNTFATWLAVSEVGVTPVPVEPRPDTYNIDPTLAEQAITPATRAIIPVHLYGQTADMDPLMELANRYGLCVVEDAPKRKVPNIRQKDGRWFRSSAATSFYPGKPRWSGRWWGNSY